MVPAQLKNSLMGILKICCILIGISTFTAIVMGISLVNERKENQKMVRFLEVASTTGTNFEDSLAVYTEKARNITDYLLGLRPANEAGFVKFISEVEKIGQDLSLNIKIKTSEETIDPKKKTKVVEPKHILYNLSFFGSYSDLMSFLIQLENMQYFIKVDNVSFENPNSMETTQQKEGSPNINIAIKLYTKK